MSAPVFAHTLVHYNISCVLDYLPIHIFPDPNASLDQQLVQMRAQLAALAQIPVVIEQSLELVTQQLSKMTHQVLLVLLSLAKQS